MKKRNNKHEKRVKKLIVACGLSAIILAVSTYAWFIGMKTVNVSSFDVKIAAIDSLSLSLDGKNFSDTVTINADNYTTVNNSNNTNSWGGSGLVPMSSVGVINTDSSRLTLYEKGSLTTTPGGYRIMASEVDNSAAETRGYVAFDLFIKNLSGEEYYPDQNVLNEEAIYLTPESEVTVGAEGAAESGIENSVRVAFAQIGRVISTTTDQATVTGITCAGGGAVTSICASRPAQIWEPNDTKHVDNAISWYTKSCNKRTGDDVTLDGSYTADPCGTIEDGTHYQTYPISGVINYTDNVDVYDGTEYNSYTKSIADEPTTGKLMNFNYFTDTDKMKTSVNRPTFMTLAPNSITKVRVYVYIEGQDIDNYDFASLGKQISINFGFTKERYNEDDVDYEGPDTDITNHVLDYEAEGDVTEIKVGGEDTTAITYNKTLKQFIISRDVKEDFTFSDNGTPKTATFVENTPESSADDTWTIN